MLRSFIRFIFFAIGWLISKWLFKLTITGRENLPPGGPLILIANHFSWFEAPLIALNLPYKPVYMGATELQEYRILKLLFYAFEAIPVWRGQVDRKAFKQALAVLQQGGVLGIMPEGGIDLEIRDRTMQGEKTAHTGNGRFSRNTLISARPGAAYLAVKSQAPILPIVFLGTENTLNNIRCLRRTPVMMIIGPVFGPLTAEPTTADRSHKRQYLDNLGDQMMYQLAALLPPENRGSYL